MTDAALITLITSHTSARQQVQDARNVADAILNQITEELKQRTATINELSEIVRLVPKTRSQATWEARTFADVARDNGLFARADAWANQVAHHEE